MDPLTISLLVAVLGSIPGFIALAMLREKKTESISSSAANVAHGASESMAAMQGQIDSLRKADTEREKRIDDLERRDRDRAIILMRYAAWVDDVLDLLDRAVLLIHDGDEEVRLLADIAKKKIDRPALEVA